jgi:hypothetical protein
MHLWTLDPCRALINKGIKKALNKSIQDFSEPVKKKCDFFFTHKIKYIDYLILAAHPCAAGTTDEFRGSLISVGTRARFIGIAILAPDNISEP